MEDLLTICRYIYWTDAILFLAFYLIGLWSIKKESKDTWKGAKTMEVKKSRKLSKEWEKKHPILDFFQSFKYEVHRKGEIPEDFYYDIKYFIQRGKKGYSKRDVWEFSYYLSDVIVKGLTDLKKMAHAVPGGMIGVQSICMDNKEEQKALELWKKEIDRIIWTFEAVKKIQDRNWIPVLDEKDRIELKKYERRLNTKIKPEDDLFGDLGLENVEPRKYHLMTKTEMQKYRKGWQLFQKYYFDLWD